MVARVETGKRNGWHEIVTFLKAQASSLLATAVDFGVTVLLANLFGFYYVYATFIGAVSGGCVNCAVNYKWTFRCRDTKKSHVALKYMLVWAGSIALNTYGTYLLTEALVAGAGAGGNIYIVAKMAVAILVACFWNYLLQRCFVFRNVHILKSIKK